MDTPLPSTKKGLKLVVIIPALNEARTIAQVIRGIPSTFDGVASREVLVINDGSTDHTAAVAQAAGASVVSHVFNRGLGVAFRTGVDEALERGADIIVNMDGDGQFNPQDIPSLILPIQRGAAEFVTATRFASAKLMPDMPRVKYWGNRAMTMIINFLTHKNFTDVSCGFRAYSRETALKLVLFGRFTYTQESFIDLAYKDVRMAEVPLLVRGEREHGKSRVASRLWRYGLKSASIIFRAARDYQPLYFIGVPGVGIFLLGVAMGFWLLAHYLQTGQTYPYRSLVQVSGILIIVGFLLLFMSLLGDMLHRNRVVLDELLYHERKRRYDYNRDHAHRPTTH